MWKWILRKFLQEPMMDLVTREVKYQMGMYELQYEPNRISEVIGKKLRDALDEVGAETIFKLPHKARFSVKAAVLDIMEYLDLEFSVPVTNPDKAMIVKKEGK